MKKSKFYLNLLWKPILLGSLLIGLSTFILLAKQATVPGGYSAKELDYFNLVRRGGLIPNNPIYLPIFYLHKLSLLIFGNTISSIRIANGLLGVISVVSIFFIVKRWYSFRIALFTCAINITLTWFLVSTRNALPEVAVLFSSVIPLVIIWLQNTKKQKIALVVTAAVIALMLYIPGLVWFVLAGLIWKFRSISHLIKSSPIWNVAASVLIFLVILVPFFINITDINFIKAIAGIPIEAKFNIVNYFNNIYTFLVNLFWNSDYKSGINIGSQAVFDIFCITLILAGSINIIKKWNRSKSKYILISLIIGTLLIGLNGSVAQIIVLPYLILLIAGGLGWLMQQWLSVFPRNPFAQNVGIILMILAVSLSVTYNAYRFYVAWPHMAKTEIKYNIQL